MLLEIKYGKYWDEQVDKVNYVSNPYFEYKQSENLKLIKEWGKKGKTLKTDLWEEAVSPDCLLSDLEEAYGIDVSPRVVELAKKSFPNLSVQDVRNLKFPERTFDFILSDSTLDHFPEIDQALSEISRVLKDDGVLVLTVHNKHNPLLMFLFFLLREKNYAYSLKDLKRLLDDVGIKITHSKNIIKVPPVLPTILNAVWKYNPFCIIDALFMLLVRILLRGGLALYRQFGFGYLIAIRGVK